MIKDLKADFPIFKTKPKLVYLDSAATSLKPQVVINKMVGYYKNYSANILRGIYQLSQQATAEYEAARQKVAKFINATSEKEIIFVRNTTEGINLVAYTWGEAYLRPGDQVVTTVMEHHSNFVPWQQLCLKKEASLEILDIDKEGRLDFRELSSLSQKAKIFAITHVSNVLGTINPVKEIVVQVKKLNPYCLVLIDGAQAVPHLPVDVQALGADFYVFSGHKMLGPTGVGVLWGKKEILERLPPFNFGGEMIKEVSLKKTVFADIPQRFEAGTPDIGGVIGLGAAVDYLEAIGREKIREHEKQLVNLAWEELRKIKGLTIFGPTRPEERGGVIAFNLEGIHPHDLVQILDEEEICLRSGHHCAMPLHFRLGIAASARVSFYLYNTQKEIEKLIAGVKKAQKVFKV